MLNLSKIFAAFILAVWALPTEVFSFPEDERPGQDVQIHRYFRTWLSAEGQVVTSPNLVSNELRFQPQEPPDIQLRQGTDSDGSFIEVELFHADYRSKAKYAELIVRSKNRDGVEDIRFSARAPVRFSNSTANFFWRSPGLGPNNPGEESFRIEFLDENEAPILRSLFHATGESQTPLTTSHFEPVLTRLTREHRDRRFEVERSFQIFVEQGSAQLHLVRVSADPAGGSNVRILQQEVIMLSSGLAIGLSPGADETRCFFSLQQISRSASQISVRRDEGGSNQPQYVADH